MRAQIADYRLERQSMQAMVEALRWAFSIGSARFRRLEEALEEPLLFLEAVVASGADRSTAVDKALDEIDDALRAAQQRRAA